MTQLPRESKGAGARELFRETTTVGASGIILAWIGGARVEVDVAQSAGEVKETATSEVEEHVNTLSSVLTGILGTFIGGLVADWSGVAG